ncbi:MAG: hypothetical protein ACFFAO_02835 [Candidatus Hermodarchaeota archaeon]
MVAQKQKVLWRVLVGSFPLVDSRRRFFRRSFSSSPLLGRIFYISSLLYPAIFPPLSIDSAPPIFSPCKPISNRLSCPLVSLRL